MKKETGSGITQEPDYAMVETGESRTSTFTASLSTTSSTITKSASYCESSFKFLNSDPVEIFYELLDKLVALGNVARQLNNTLGRNKNRAQEEAKLIQDLKR